MSVADDVKDFEEAWSLFEQKIADLDDKTIANIRGIFMSGGYAAVGVLTNRLAALPGTVEPGAMVQALIETIHTALAELELKANEDFETKTYGSA